MKERKPAKKPAINVKDPAYFLSPAIPGAGTIGPLKDMAQAVTAASAALEGKVAKETAAVLGDRLRLINSYYSNLIEGHKTTIPDIQSALHRKFHQDPEKKYAQELCAAHVETEGRAMDAALSSGKPNVCRRSFLEDMHAAFYANLPSEHLYTHTAGGFTNVPVKPGTIRDVNVSVDGRSLHGPDHGDLPELLETFAGIYDPARFFGDERLIAAASSHHRLTWLHPFRDGNGRVARLFTGLYLARIGINQSNLWSLSRGLSRGKNRYMFELWTTDSPGAPNRSGHFDDDLLADFCDFFFATCLDQIRFMDRLLQLENIESRIDWYVETRARSGEKPMRTEAARLLRAVFMRGAVARGAAGEVMNMSGRNARRIVSSLIEKGLLQSGSHRAPLTIGLPAEVLPYYFPDLHDPPAVDRPGHP